MTDEVLVIHCGCGIFREEGREEDSSKSRLKLSRD
jgi:hypothetical protein